MHGRTTSAHGSPSIACHLAVVAFNDPRRFRWQTPFRMFQKL